LRKIKENGVERKLVAITSNEKIMPRHGYEIFNNNGKKIGVITSGTLSPVLGKPIAMGYVKKEFAEIDTTVTIKVRNKEVTGIVVKLPFISK
jgi:aminomethyltransferase